MTFAEFLDQALVLLQRHGRVTYQTFQLQFQRDEAHLAALKAQLLYAYPQVIDDAGHGLVWTAERPALHPEVQRKIVAEERFHALLPAVMGLLRKTGHLLHAQTRLWPRCGAAGGDPGRPYLPAARH